MLLHFQRVTLGYRHYGALTSSGSLLVFGSNEQGQLGIAQPPTPFEFSAIHPRIGATSRTSMSSWDTVPRHLNTPMEISFTDTASGGEVMEVKEKRNYYVINVAFGGHQSCALVAYLEPDQDEDQQLETEIIPEDLRLGDNEETGGGEGPESGPVVRRRKRARATSGSRMRISRMAQALKKRKKDVIPPLSGNS
jgi:hypothetical protein